MPSMKLSKEQVNDFIELYKKHYGVELEFYVAMEKATRLIRLIQVVESNISTVIEDKV